MLKMDIYTRNDEIYSRYVNGESVRNLADAYKVSASRIYSIISRAKYQKDPVHCSELYSEFANFTTPSNAMRYSLALERAGIWNMAILRSVSRVDLLSVWGISNTAMHVIDQIAEKNGFEIV